ncbi:hypothetical protein HAPAU_00110 [Halalkalicoccus paucihalophilus]|jgi:hypothetical protein|uniref:Uncharacterized protein n=1 Tax=Halalkalicoccus paucihalophilus TaxID=1008153 RepID=A0A151AID9_9EURY|nr:hypothetical protein [Halalkalicoccus paucihalophilus]KYH27345.1 hypothetical protein HAPAU_00110 [Halalkalicoccus paucihalophilus]
MNRSQFSHPAFRTAAGTLAGYGLLLLVLTVLLFLVPYAIFAGF